MYPQNTHQQQQQQQWGPSQSSVDESEDDEVKGIFRKQVVNPHQQMQQIQQQQQQQQQQGDFDDEFVHNFSGLMGFIETPQRSQLNANVPAFMPEYQQHQQHHHQQQQQQQQQFQQQMMQQHYGGLQQQNHQQDQQKPWQDVARTNHRTPGPPSQQGSANASNPSPFRFNFSFNYPPGKTGLTPTNFAEEPFGNTYGMGLMGANYGKQTGAAYPYATNQQGPGIGQEHYQSQNQQATTTNWYEQLPSGSGQQANGDNNRVAGDTSSSSNTAASNKPHDSQQQQNMNFGAPFLGSSGQQQQPENPFYARSNTTVNNQQQGMYQQQQQQQRAVPGHTQLQHQDMYPSFAGQASPQYNQPLPNEFNGGKNSYYPGQQQQQQQPVVNQQETQRRSTRGPPPGGFQLPGYNNSGQQGQIQGQRQQPQPQQQQQQQQQRQKQQQQIPRSPPQSPPQKSATTYGYAAAAAGGSKANYAKAAQQGNAKNQQQQQHFQKHNNQQQRQQQQQPPQQTSTYYHDSRQPLANANHRVSISEEDERKRQNSTSSTGTRDSKSSNSKHRQQQQHHHDSLPRGVSSNNRRISHSIDSTRSSASSSIGSHTSSRDSNMSKKRQDLEETAATRAIFKEFYKTFRQMEKESFESAFSYAQKCLRSKEYPEKIHYKLYLEMADLAKRENRFQQARDLYQVVNETQPYAPQGWLEYSKMLEELGLLFQCRQVLYAGLEYCNFSEQLLTKAIKLEERLSNLQGARALLARLRNQSVEKSWRVILEGALLEARAGNIVVARKVFKYLMRHVPWYGPIYYEATKFEEKNEEFERAIAIVEKGLREIPRYGPLWFTAFRLHEKIEMENTLNEQLSGELSKGSSTSTTKITINNILKQVDGKSSLNLYEMFGVESEFETPPVQCKLLRTRGALQRAMNCISKELLWKVHFETAQVAERGQDKQWLRRARNAYVQAILRCPVNLRWKVWLAGARSELASDNVDLSRQLLIRALNDVPPKSKAQVLLEMARVEEYCGNVDKARSILAKSRQETRQEWKVWLESVQIEIRHGNTEDAIRAAEDALAIHNGTGRLWAILVQLKQAHGPDAQRLVFREALKEVPKSGEVWAEGARIHLNPLSPHMDLDTAQRYLHYALQFTPQFGDSLIELLRLQLLVCAFSRLSEEAIDDENLFRSVLEECDISELELQCNNASPNYGSLWFCCKSTPFDTPKQVLQTAKRLLVAELTKFRHAYRESIYESIRQKAHPKPPTKARTTPALASGENNWLFERLHQTPGAETYADFSTGLLSVNWLRAHADQLVDAQRRKLLFGSDQIVP